MVILPGSLKKALHSWLRWHEFTLPPQGKMVAITLDPKFDAPLADWLAFIAFHSSKPRVTKFS